MSEQPADVSFITNMLNIAIIVGSTRPGRKALDVARWVHDIAGRRSNGRERRHERQ